MLNCKTLGKYYNGGNFDISFHHSDTLEYCPQHITGGFRCDNNRLSSLTGGPQKVDGDYNCSFNSLTDLVGCASHISSELYIQDNNITSLVGIHKIIKSCNTIFLDFGKIKEGGIGLLLIENLSRITTDYKQFEIIYNYLGTGAKGMMECRKELIDNGYALYAKL